MYDMMFTHNKDQEKPIIQYFFKFAMTYRVVKEVDELHVAEQLVSGHGQSVELTHLHEELPHPLPGKREGFYKFQWKDHLCIIILL